MNVASGGIQQRRRKVLFSLLKIVFFFLLPYVSFWGFLVSTMRERSARPEESRGIIIIKVLFFLLAKERKHK